jgi:hypothetical protein
LVMSMHMCCCCQVLPKVKQQLESAHRDVAAVAADLHRGVQRNMREMQVCNTAEAEGAGGWVRAQHAFDGHQGMGRQSCSPSHSHWVLAVVADDQLGISLCVSLFCWQAYHFAALCGVPCCYSAFHVAVINVLCCAVQDQSSEALRGLTCTLDAAAAEAEVTLAPIARQQAEQAQRQLQQLEHQWKQAAAEYDRGSQQQGRGRGQQRQRQRPASSSDGDWEA